MKGKFVTTVLFLIAFLITAQAAIGDVYINEIMVNPTDGVEWVELYNDGTSSVDLEGWSLMANSGTIHEFNLDEEDIVPIGYFTVNLSGDLLDNDGDTIRLIDESDNTIDGITYEDSDVEEDYSYARLHDGLDEFVTSDEPTYGEANNRLPVSVLPSVTLREGVEGAENYSVNISEKISDVDGDTLSFTLGEVSNVVCSINDNQLDVEF